MWRWKLNRLLLCTWDDLDLLVDWNKLARKSDYKIRWPERYPDSANLLPIPVAAGIFVHGIVNLALTWVRRSEGV